MFHINHPSPPFFFLMLRRPPRSTLFPYPPLFRSLDRRTRRRLAPPPAGPRHHPIRAEAAGRLRTGVSRVSATLKLPHNQPHMQETLSSQAARAARSEEHTSELQSRSDLVCRLLLE